MRRARRKRGKCKETRSAARAQVHELLRFDGSIRYAKRIDAVRALRPGVEPLGRSCVVISRADRPACVISPTDREKR